MALAARMVGGWLVPCTDAGWRGPCLVSDACSYLVQFGRQRYFKSSHVWAPFVHGAYFNVGFGLVAVVSFKSVR